MNIGFIHYTAPKEERGGVETVLSEHIEFLVSKGFNITLIYGRGGGLDSPKIKEYIIPEMHASHPTIQKLQKSIFEDKIDKAFKDEFNATKEFLKEKIIKALDGVDICFVHNIPSLALNFALTLAINEIIEKVPIKFVYWLHDSFVLIPQNQNYVNKWPFTELHYYNSKIKYITITEYRKKQFSNLPENFALKDIQVITNGINVEDYIKFDEKILLLKKDLNIEWEDFIILMPVRITPRKNIELGLKIVAELKKLLTSVNFEIDFKKHLSKPVEVRLIVTGPPDNQAIIEGENYFDYIKKIRDELQLQNNVIFAYKYITYYKSYENEPIGKFSVSEAYALSDCVLVTSKEEGFGLPLIEAAAAKKIIFCSRIPVFQELLREGIDGYMFDLNENPELIAHRIFRVYLGNTVENYFSRVIRNYNWKEILNHDLIPLINSLTNEN